MAIERRSLASAAAMRIPFEGSIDLTYRCNNDCRHCWVRLPPDDPARAEELTADEIRRIVDEARAMGCREWSISGGEPMLRPDFAEVFAHITAKCVRYILNTNGTLITPDIARLLKQGGGNHLVALYGATAAVCDHVTRSPGSFERTMRGIAYLREAGAPFTVQVIPMRDNFHEYDAMAELARTLSPVWRVGAPWLYLSANGDPARNREIAAQRLEPAQLVALDMPDPTAEERWGDAGAPTCGGVTGDRLYAGCVAGSNRFHVDPRGGLSFCCFVKDPALRYDLRAGSFRDGWERFLPAAAGAVRGGAEYAARCGACEYRRECRWCPVYGYLEHGRHGAPVEYLCEAAREGRRFRDNWRRHHRRYFDTAGITIQVDCDLPFTDTTFEPKFRPFERPDRGPDTVSIRHHFGLPPLNRDLGPVVYDSNPWRIHRLGRSWIYLCGMKGPGSDATPYQVAVFSHDHGRARIYHRDDRAFRRGNINALTFFATDQILLAQLLADRSGLYLHSSGAVLNGHGLLFTGHSEAGKSTMMRIVQPRAEWLTDDRMIVRRWPEGFRVHGSWSHGEIPQVSPNSAPLGGILFLEQAGENRLIRMDDRRDIAHRLIACLIKPMVTAEWWTKTLEIVERIAAEAPCYRLRFDLSGKVLDVLEEHFPTPAAAAAGGAP